LLYFRTSYQLLFDSSFGSLINNILRAIKDFNLQSDSSTKKRFTFYPFFCPKCFNELLHVDKASLAIWQTKHFSDYSTTFLEQFKDVLLLKAGKKAISKRIIEITYHMDSNDAVFNERNVKFVSYSLFKII